LIEIKIPFDKSIVSVNPYRDNHIPNRDLSGSIMQIEKYIYYLNKTGIRGEKQLTEKYKSRLPDDLEIKTPTGSIGARGTEFAVVTESDTKSTVVLLGPGVNNTLGMVPGNLRVTDGNINIDITQPGFQTVVFK
jgi:hypothetical protein